MQHGARKVVCDLECNVVTRLVFPRRFRLSRREGFSRILQQASNTRDWFSVYSQPNPDSITRLGISVSKRVVPGAVKRNRIKRLIRECFRQHTHHHVAKDVVIRVRKPLDESKKSSARILLSAMLDKALLAK